MKEHRCQRLVVSIASFVKCRVSSVYVETSASTGIVTSKSMQNGTRTGTCTCMMHCTLSDRLHCTVLYCRVKYSENVFLHTLKYETAHPRLSYSINRRRYISTRTQSQRIVLKEGI